MVEVKELKVEHVLMFVIVAFLLYHFMSGCGCTNRGDGFSVGAQSDCIGKTCKLKECAPCDPINPLGSHCGTNLHCDWIQGGECPGRKGFYCVS
jgi:hypothetical protein